MDYEVRDSIIINTCTILNFSLCRLDNFSFALFSFLRIAWVVYKKTIQTKHKETYTGCPKKRNVRLSLGFDIRK